MKAISIDPSGTGTTGICLIEDNKYIFDEFKSKDWKEHLRLIVELVKNEKPDFIIFEKTNYIYGRQHQGIVGLYNLMGGITALRYAFEFIKEINFTYVNQVKALRDKIQSGIEIIEGLSYKVGRGKGWLYEGKRVSLHQIDALIIYHLWAKENYPSEKALREEIAELEFKGRKIGKNQKARLSKLKNLLDVI